MPILNYTTKVPVSRTVGEIQAMLARAGARRMMIDYDAAGQPEALAFQIEVDDNGPLHYRLPCRFREVQAVLVADGVSARQQTAEHARRVAWRIVKDWLEAQLAIIAAGMSTLDEVMLPYTIVNGGRTLYEVWNSERLLEAKEE